MKLVDFEIFISLIFICGFGDVDSDTFSITATVRDFWPCQNAENCGKYGVTNVTCDPSKCMRNFEEPGNPSNHYWSGPNDLWMVNYLLGNDRRPILNMSAPHYTIADPSNFYYWFNTDPNQGYNRAIPVNITLDNTVCVSPETCNGKTYGYRNNEFYPLTNDGFGNYGPSYSTRNYHFCVELHNSFTYAGNEIFAFTGDDDLWVYINKQLVIDIGGIHPPRSASVQLNTTNIGLVVGETYPFDLFQCERHTDGSNMALFTSIALFCPVRDFCGVCGGDGTSCCKCNDGSVCTTDKCNATTGQCIFEPIACPVSADKCLQPACNKNSGCYNTPISCGVNDKCSSYSCDSSYGCLRLKTDCDDGNSCTEDGCNPTSGCTHTPIQGCTKCSGVVCNQTDFCFPKKCNETDGACHIGAKRSCDDGNACTIDDCAYGQCTVTGVISCNDNDVCTVDTCNTTSGCQYDKIKCDDQNACTNDYCNSVTGCYFVPITLPATPPCKVVTCDEIQGVIISDRVCYPESKCKCNPQTNDCDCGNFFSNLSTPAKVGAGVIAGAVIAGVAGLAILIFSSKKGYDYYKLKTDLNNTNVQNNPMYVESTNQGVSPLYVDNSASA